MEEVMGLMGFIDAAPTAFHAVSEISDALLEAGYVPLEETDAWDLQPEGRYFFTRNQSSIIAFRVPEYGFDHFQVIASHCDSPCFKLKAEAGRQSVGYASLNVEKYGGMLMSTWFDRPLSIAGRLIVREGGALRTKLVNVDRNLAVIPNMPIHFNRDANDGVALNAQVDTLPVYGLLSESEPQPDYLDLVADCAGVDRDSVAGYDLFLYNRDRGTLCGAEDEFILSPRLDDLACAYTSLRAFLEARPSAHIDMLCVFDNEEVGSNSKQGADSTMLSDAMSRIAAGLGAQPWELSAAQARSFMLSADNAHAVHPNHPEKYDEKNRVRMNGGVVVKFNAAQKYTSDGVSQAVFETVCRRAGVPVQRFANRSDIRGGSTLGNIANSHVSMNTVDIGLAQLAMHSANETMGARDVDLMIRAMQAFYETEISIQRDGLIQLD